MDHAASQQSATPETTSLARRALLAGLATLGLGHVVLPNVAVARRKVRGEHNVRGTKAIMCVNGVTVRVPKKKRKKYLKQGATRGECRANPTCVPACPAGRCGDDGCGGTCACPTGQVCAINVCERCTISCTEDPIICGETLQTALDAAADGDNLYICPGRYTPSAQFGFTFTTAVNVFGAGSGDDPTVDTILDAAGQQGKSPFYASPINDKSMRVSGLRLTGGQGIYGMGLGTMSIVTVENCAVVGNNGGAVGGIQSGGQLTLVNSLVANNTVVFGGFHNPGSAGVYISNYLATTPLTSTITNSVITGNTGKITGGVSLWDSVNYVCTLTLDSTTQVTNNTITDTTTGDRAGGISRVDIPGNLGSITVNGTTISGNTNPQCYDVIGCSS